MRRPLDGASLKSQFLRRRIVVNGGMRIVDLGIEHLVWPAPWSGERIGSFRDHCLERSRGHEFPPCDLALITCRSSRAWSSTLPTLAIVTSGPVARSST